VIVVKAFIICNASRLVFEIEEKRNYYRTLIFYLSNRGIDDRYGIKYGTEVATNAAEATEE